MHELNESVLDELIAIQSEIDAHENAITEAQGRIRSRTLLFMELAAQAETPVNIAALAADLASGIPLPEIYITPPKLTDERIAELTGEAKASEEARAEKFRIAWRIIKTAGKTAFLAAVTV